MGRLYSHFVQVNHRKFPISGLRDESWTKNSYSFLTLHEN